MDHSPSTVGMHLLLGQYKNKIPIVIPSHLPSLYTMYSSIVQYKYLNGINYCIIMHSSQQNVT